MSGGERGVHTNGPAAEKALPPPPRPSVAPHPAAARPEPHRRRPGSPAKPRLVLGAIAAVLVAIFASTTVALWQAVDRVDSDVASLSEDVQDAGDASIALSDRVAALEGEKAAAFDPAEVIERVSPSVFAILAPAQQGTSLGSAFVLSKTDDASRLVTNYHVIAERWEEGASDVLVTRGQREYIGEIIRVNPDNDLALIEVQADFPALEPTETPVRVGDTVVVIGSPIDPELEGTVTTGIVSAVDRNIDGLPWVQFSAAINPGNSGGPVMDADGQVVGVATLKGVGEGLGFAIPIDRVCTSFDVC